MGCELKFLTLNHTVGTKYSLTGERRYLRFSARVNEAADDLLWIQMTNLANFPATNGINRHPREIGFAPEK